MQNMRISIRAQIVSVNLITIAVTILLTMLGTVGFTMEQNKKIMDQNLLNSARLISHVPFVARDLENGAPTQELWDFLDISISQNNDIDVIAVADVNSVQYYYPDRQYIGKAYAGSVQERILTGEEAFTSDDTGISGAERCAYAPVRAEDGTLLGFVMVGLTMRNVSLSIWTTLLPFFLIAVSAVGLGILLSFNLSYRIKESLMGYEPEDFLGLFHQREEILEALEEGVLAIDDATTIIYLNQAACKMLGTPREDAMGRRLHDAFPQSTLDRILRVKRTERNIPLLYITDERILADCMPIWGDGQLIGAVAILRSRTEVTRLAKDLTGVRHMVDAMRAYTHEFLNKLHVILGLLQIGRADKAEEYIMDVTSIHQKAVGSIMRSIEDPSVAALLVGKTSRCAELGIRLRLGPNSSLHADAAGLPSDAFVTMLGNLIENAIEALNSSVSTVKEITVSLQENADDLLICVEDTGPGMESELVKNIFQWGFTTKGGDHGTGLPLVMEVVTAYRGQIRVESEPGMGTAFFLTFQHSQPTGKEPTDV